jgi:2'-5' RNA ligase
MPFAVEMFFDESADKLVRDVWNDLARANVTSSMIDGGYRPHITLGVFEGYTSPKFEDELRFFTEKRRVFPIKLDYLGVFPRPEGVVYFGAVVTGQLLTIHGEYTRLFAPLVTAARPYYLPGSWVPHCTLACGLSAVAIPATVEVCSRSMLPINAEVKEIGLVEFPGHREVLTCELASGPRTGG